MDTYLCPKLEKRKSKAAFSCLAASDPAFMLLFICKIFEKQKKPDFGAVRQLKMKIKINVKRRTAKSLLITRYSRR